MSMVALNNKKYYDLGLRNQNLMNIYQRKRFQLFQESETVQRDRYRILFNYLFLNYPQCTVTQGAGILYSHQREGTRYRYPVNRYTVQTPSYTQVHSTDTKLTGTQYRHQVNRYTVQTQS